jgi:diguanylate cyclase (GGDEF)-like protein
MLLSFFHYHTPEPREVKFNRLILGLLLISGVISQRIEFLYAYFVISAISVVTLIHYSPTTYLYKFIAFFFNGPLCTISPAYERSYAMHKESEFFELSLRLVVVSIAIYAHSLLPLAGWLIAIFMGIFMMISTFFGFCLSALGYIGLKFINKAPSESNVCTPDRRLSGNRAGTNMNCLLARNGFKPYARCDYCSLKAPQCGGVHETGFIFGISFLTSLFLFIHNPAWIIINIVIIVVLLFWLAHEVTLNTDQLATADFQNRELNEKLKHYSHTLENEVSKRTLELEKLVKIDSLTGLVNRFEFERQLEMAMKNAREDEAQHVMCYIDLDQFKIVNDKCGHIAGDELLRQVALILKRSAKESDVVARLGGDEFGIIYIDTTIEEANIQAQKLLHAIGEYRFNYQSNMFAIGASIGMVGIIKECCTLVNLLSQADAACYAAKDGGRNRIHITHPEDTAIQERRNQMQWIGRLEEALVANAFALFIQPIVPVLDILQRNSYEVLVRLREANGELVPPMAFIPAAQRYGFMLKLDRWVIENTFKAFVKTWDDVSQELHFSINISGVTLGDDGTIQFIKGLFGDYGVPYRTITFEITETEAVGNMSNALSFIHEFRALGCKFALDDFGCGLSSFSYLQNMPVDYLKIDGSFVHDIHMNPINRAMVDAINQIGHVMGIATVCEYVENGAVLRILDELGVDFAQGYHIGKPQPIETLFTIEG